MEKENPLSKSDSNWTQVVIQILTIILLAVMTFYFYKLQGTLSDLIKHIENQEVILEQPPTSSRREFSGAISVQDSPTINDADNAKVVVVEFSDFECPFCAKASQTVSQLQKDRNMVLFVHKDFPLKYHTQAENAAVAARCAGEQNKFWEYYQLIYSEASFSEESYIDYAGKVGVDIQSFKTCLEDPEQLNRVKQDFEEGIKLKIDKVPLFIVGNFSINNGNIQVQGAYYSADELAAAIDLYTTK
ncbi:MAG: thioredoxin domain-containing protein [Bacteroidetes bacterium]|nr:thioredoxin domain-containing protein [Bacteroidota bacterium]